MNAYGEKKKWTEGKVKLVLLEVHGTSLVRKNSTLSLAFHSVVD